MALAAILAMACVSVVPQQALAADPDLDRAIAFRESVGLRSDRPWVQTLVASSARSQRFGVALTPAEEADLDSRIDMQDRLDPLARALDAEPDFGGMYVDQKAGGVVTVSFTVSNSRLRSLVNRLAPSGARILIRTVTYSKASLGQLMGRVSDEARGWLGQGITISGVEIDDAANRVRILVAGLTDSATQLLEAKYGPEVEVAEGALPTPASCTGPTNCGSPIKGGIVISANVGCSAGYWGHVGATKYLVTAGHCIWDNAGGSNWTHNGTYVGVNGAYSFSNGATTDSGLIAATTETGPYNQYLEYLPGATTIGTFNGYRYSSAMSGNIVCLAGAVNDPSHPGIYWRCDATVGSSDADLPYPGLTIHHTARLNIPGPQGDSGTTVVDPNGILYGVFDATTATDSWFSPADRIQTVLGVTPCYTPTCGPDGSTYHPLGTTRILDTRSGLGLSGAFSVHVARTLQVTGYGQVPTNATAVTGNLTVTGQTSLGYLYVGPTAMNNPTSSTMNFPVNDDRANGVTVALGAGGTLGITYVAPTYGPTAHVLFDVTGYFT